MIETKGLCKVYKGKSGDVKALDDVSLLLPDKGLVFVTGPSGSGKSTLLNMIGGLDKVTEGSVMFDGLDITTLTENQLAKYRNRHVGFIFQDFCLLEDMTVLDNIAITQEMQSNIVEDKSEILGLMDELGLSGLEDRRAKKLSAGQKQRVSIARAMIKNPKIILADEPTGNLDGHSGKLVLTSLKRMSEKTLVVIISHNLNDAYTYGDRIIRLEKGKIIFDKVSTHADEPYLVENSKLYLGNLYDLEAEDLKVINSHLGDIGEIKRKSELFDDNNSSITLNNPPLF